MSMARAASVPGQAQATSLSQARVAARATSPDLITVFIFIKAAPSPRGAAVMLRSPAEAA